MNRFVSYNWGTADVMPVNLRKLSSLGPVNSFPIHSQRAETPRGCPRLKANFKGHAQEPAASSPPSEEEVDWPGDVVAMEADDGYRGDVTTILTLKMVHRQLHRALQLQAVHPPVLAAG